MGKLASASLLSKATTPTGSHTLSAEDFHSSSPHEGHLGLDVLAASQCCYVSPSSCPGCIQDSFLLLSKGSEGHHQWCSSNWKQKLLMAFIFSLAQMDPEKAKEAWKSVTQVVKAVSQPSFIPQASTSSPCSITPSKSKLTPQQSSSAVVCSTQIDQLQTTLATESLVEPCSFSSHGILVPQDSSFCQFDLCSADCRSFQSFCCLFCAPKSNRVVP